MNTAKNVLANVLVLQDRVGVRQSGHFDHDSHAMSGPAEVVQKRKVGKTYIGANQSVLQFRFERDKETGEFLSI